MTSLEQRFPPSDLEDRGASLWAAVVKQYDLDPGGMIVLEEACRVADRLQRLHKVLGDRKDQAWFSLEEDSLDLVDSRSSGTVAKIKICVDQGLTETRQQQLAFRQLIDRLGIGHGEYRQQVEDDPFADFAKRAAERAAERAAKKEA